MHINLADIARARRLIALNEMKFRRDHGNEVRKFHSLPAITTPDIDVLFISRRGNRQQYALAA